MMGTTTTMHQVAALAEFLQRHLPTMGHRCIAHHSGRRFSASFHRDDQQAAARAIALDALGDGEVYFGCASYADPSMGRKGSNVSGVRSCWLDIDTRESKVDAPYANKDEAKLALAHFCWRLSLPAPTLVDSGNGLHAYWSVEEEISPETWRDLANLLKAATIKAGLKADHSRTTDIASVLRMPGTLNRKDRHNVRPVKLLSMGEPAILIQLLAGLWAYAGVEETAARLAQNTGVPSNLLVSPGFQPSDADRIADQCAVIRHIRDVQGDVPEPLWHGGLGVLVHTIQSDAVCHAWSRGHPRYSAGETQAKIERLRIYGPTTCVRLRSISGDLCNGCVWRGDE